MDALFEKIYEEVIRYEKDMDAMYKAMEHRNERISLKYENVMDEKEREGLVKLLDETAIQAGKEGFYMGLRYACKGILALLGR